MVVESLLKEKYGITTTALSKMEGYDSINYKVTEKGTNYVLKIYDYTKATVELLMAESSILQCCSKLESFDFPFPITSLKNELLVIENDKIYRLLSYVEGHFLGDVEHTSFLLHSLGIFLGSLDKTITTEYHAPIFAKEIQWDLRYFNKNHKFLKHILCAKDRSLVDYFFMQYDEQIGPIQDQLRKGIIHNDGNDWNVLTDEGKVSGIIDFGDMCYSWVINEIAVAITYIMMEKEYPLQHASEVIKGYSKVFPLEEIELSILYYLVAARLCTSVCNSAYAKILKPNSEYITVSEKPAWNLLRKWLTINPIKAEDSFRTAAGYLPINKSNLKIQLEKRNRFLSESLSLSYKKPIHMKRSAFQYMYDVDGNTYLDAYNNIMLAGHCHPKVVKAGQKTLARLNTNTRYIYDDLQEYSEKLLSKFPSTLNKVIFVNSGSAAGDLALRMAMHFTKKNKILALEHGYHGNTKITIEASHYKYSSTKGNGQKDYILKTPMPKEFNSGLNSDSAGKHFAEITSKTIKENENQIAAFIAEPIIGCGGQVPLAKGYLKSIYSKIRTQGGICISDEVQVGFGRLGDSFWGFELHDVVPDIVVLGKPMGNGHPIGAVVTTSEIATSFEKGPEFFSSFGGNPVSCAIGLAVLKVIEEEELQKHAKSVGDYFKKKMYNLSKEYTCIVDVRGNGLFLGIELLNTQGHADTTLAAGIKNYFRENFILIGTDGPYDNVLKIKPPLSFTTDNVDRFITVFKNFLQKSI